MRNVHTLASLVFMRSALLSAGADQWPILSQSRAFETYRHPTPRARISQRSLS